MKSCKQKFQKKPVIVEAFKTDVVFIIVSVEGRMCASPGGGCV